MAYERKVCDFLRGVYDKCFYEGVWFRYIDRHGTRYCQADGIMANPETNEIFIFEVKLKHSGRAWWQLHTLYRPVVAHAFGDGWDIKVIEVTNVHDPLVEYPTPIKLTRSLDSFAPFPTTNILIWRG